LSGLLAARLPTRPVLFYFDATDRQSVAADKGSYELKKVAMRKLMITALLMGIAGTVFAEEMRMPINADDLQWGPIPNAFKSLCLVHE
jgi:hypothetical protein